MNNGFNALIESHLSTLDTEYIDSFRELVFESVENRASIIENKYESHKNQNYKDPELKCLNDSWIQDDVVFLEEVSLLADELSIVALYKQFEIKHKEILMYYKYGKDETSLSYWNNIIKILPEKAKNLDAFNSVNELRLINNSIKHEGVVSDELSREFPRYKTGSKLTKLDKIFMRLKSCVINYINELQSILSKSS